MVTVARVRPGTIADELGITPGTQLLAVNGREVDDFLDWEFLTADDALVVHARLPGGEDLELDIEALGALYLGGVRPSALALAGRIRGTRETLARAEAMFPWHPLPWCPEIF